MLAAVLTFAGMQPAFPSITSGVVHDPYVRHRPRRRYVPRYPFSSDRQDARRFITVTGRNGHQTIQRIK